MNQKRRTNDIIASEILKLCMNGACQIARSPIFNEYAIIYCGTNKKAHQFKLII